MTLADLLAELEAFGDENGEVPTERPSARSRSADAGLSLAWRDRHHASL